MLFGCFFSFVYIIGEALKNKIYNKFLPTSVPPFFPTLQSRVGMDKKEGKKNIIFFHTKGYLTYPYISPCKARKKPILYYHRALYEVSAFRASHGRSRQGKGASHGTPPPPCEVRSNAPTSSEGGKTGLASHVGSST